MEWIIGLLFIWFVWRLLTGQARREVTLKKAINDAFLFHAGEDVCTNIYWEAAERFAQDHGAQTDKWADGGQAISFEMSVNNKKVMVTFIRNRLNGKACIYVDKLKRYKKQVEKNMKNVGLKIPTFK